MKPIVRPLEDSFIQFAPVIAIVAGLGGIVADPTRSFVSTILSLGVVGLVVVVLAVHRRVAGQLREALTAADAELAAHARTQQFELAEREKLEAQLLQAQKMELIGQQASGLAHDFNNTLMAAGGYADLLSAESASPNLQAYSDAIAQVMERGSELTRQLLAFARPTDSVIEPVDVRPVVTGIVPLIRRLLGPGIEVNVEIPERPMIVRFDGCQLEHALINLSINARDAMPAGGRMTVLVNDGRSPTWDAAASGPDAFVEIAVRDSGSGIPTEHMDRIFEPFFTTKREGHGSGLGLSMVRRFAAAAGGDVIVDSALGVGTTVAIRLPRTVAAELSSPPIGRQPPQPEHIRHRPGRSCADRLAAGTRG